MKKIIVVLIYTFFIPVIVFSQDLFTGKWKIEVLGTKENWFLDHNESGSTLTINGIDINTNIQINESDLTIVVPAFYMMADKFRYKSNKDGTIDLYVVDKFNVDMTASFTKSFRSQLTGNSLTTDAFNIFVEKMQKIMFEIPMLRFIKME